MMWCDHHNYSRSKHASLTRLPVLRLLLLLACAASATASSVLDRCAEAPSTCIPNAKAVFDYAAEDDSNMKMAVGDMLVVTDKSDPDWWVGYVQGFPGTVGYFPSAFVEPIAAPESKPSPLKPSCSSSSSSSSMCTVTSSNTKSTGTSGDATTTSAAGVAGEAEQQERSNGAPAQQEQEQKQEEQVAEQVAATTGDIVKVLFDYKAADADGLNLQAGDEVILKDTSDADYWSGSSRSRPDEVGFFPASFVKKMDRSKALFDYSDAEDENSIKMSAGDVLVVTDKSDADWYEGYVEGKPEKVGTFPASFVEPMHSQGQQKDAPVKATPEAPNTNTCIASVSSVESTATVTFSDGLVSDFHYTWIRDNSNGALHPSGQGVVNASHIGNVSHIDPLIRATSLRLLGGGDTAADPGTLTLPTSCSSLLRRASAATLPLSR